LKKPKEARPSEQRPQKNKNGGENPAVLEKTNLRDEWS
jgi:hypothetical protein